MKRFYKTVSLSQAQGGYSLTLDGKSIQTPARNLLLIENLRMAEAVRAEWDAQKDEVLPETMPLSQLSMTLVDRVVPNRVALMDEAFGYLDTDLLCYRAEEPEMYRQAQEAAWNPPLQKLTDFLGCQIQTTSGLSVLEQSAELHSRVRTYLETLDDGLFMALYLVTLGSGSLLLAVGFVAGLLSEQEVIDAAFAEENLKDKIYLGEIYGSAPDQEKRLKMLKTELSALSKYISLTKEQK